MRLIVAKWLTKSPRLDSNLVEIVYVKPEARLRDQGYFQFLDYETMEDASWGLQNEMFVPLLGGGLVRSGDVVELRNGYWHTFEQRDVA